MFLKERKKKINKVKKVLRAYLCWGEGGNGYGPSFISVNVDNFFDQCRLFAVCRLIRI